MVNKCLNLTVFLACIIFFSIIMGTLSISSAADTEGTFTGTWVANGSKDILPFGEKRETAIFKFSGHVSLKGALGAEKDYWAKCIGLADSDLGSNARCVWRALSGQEIYIMLQSKLLAKGSSVLGTIVGGTGTVSGIKGSLSFEWTTMSFQKQENSTDIGGYATNLNGTFQLP